MQFKTKSVENYKNNVDSDKATSYSIGVKSANIFAVIRQKIYTHRYRTHVQEVLSNALDAHRQVGKQDTPIVVTFPTPDKPTIRVRDFGPGMSPDLIKNVVTQLGESTKNTSNDQVGGFGVGFVSPLAVVESFNVTTWQNGICYEYLVHTGNTAAGEMQLLSSYSSGDPEGTEVSISYEADKVSKVIAAIYRATWLWDVKPETRGLTQECLSEIWLNAPSVIDGSDYRIFSVEALKGLLLDVRGISKQFYVDAEHEFLSSLGVKSQYNYSSVLLANLDGIPYPVTLHNENYFTDIVKNVIFVQDFKTGELEVSVSRETLVSTENSELNLKNLTSGFKSDKILEEIRNRVGKLKTLDDKLCFLKTTEKYLEAYEFPFSHNKFQYTIKGFKICLPFPEGIEAQGFRFKTSSRHTFKISEAKPAKSIPFSLNGTTIVVVDRETKPNGEVSFAFSGKNKTRVVNYFRDTKLGYSNYGSSNATYIIRPSNKEEIEQLRKSDFASMLTFLSDLPEVNYPKRLNGSTSCSTKTREILLQCVTTEISSSVLPSQFKILQDDPKVFFLGKLGNNTPSSYHALRKQALVLKKHRDIQVYLVKNSLFQKLDSSKKFEVLCETLVFSKKELTQLALARVWWQREKLNLKHYRLNSYYWLWDSTFKPSSSKLMVEFATLTHKLKEGASSYPDFYSTLSTKEKTTVDELVSSIKEKFTKLDTEVSEKFPLLPYLQEAKTEEVIGYLQLVDK